MLFFYPIICNNIFQQSCSWSVYSHKAMGYINFNCLFFSCSWVFLFKFNGANNKHRSCNSKVWLKFGSGKQNCTFLSTWLWYTTYTLLCSHIYGSKNFSFRNKYEICTIYIFSVQDCICFVIFISKAWLCILVIVGWFLILVYTSLCLHIIANVVCPKISEIKMLCESDSDKVIVFIKDAQWLKCFRTIM